jgi:hypothetical protein
MLDSASPRGEEDLNMNRWLAPYVCALVLCWWLGGASAAGPSGNVSQPAPAPAAAAGEAAGPTIHVPESTFDFGEVAEGSQVSHDFTVLNTGKETLEIHQVSPG